MRRLVQIVLLFAIMIPFGIAVQWGVNLLPRDLALVAGGIPIGIGIAYALWCWDDRIKERQSRGIFTFWD